MLKRPLAAALTALAFLGATATSCTDLTIPPKSTLTDANVFSDPNSYKSFIARAYAGLGVSGQQGPSGRPDIQGIDEGFSQYLRLLWEAQELPTDEAVIAWGDVGLPEMNTQTWAVTNSFVVSMYYRIYFQVGMTNEFLRQTTDAKLAERANLTDAIRADIKTYRAEARFLRALSYWHGIDLFGNIPLVRETDPLGSTPPPQATRKEIYDFLISELTAIQGELPAPGAATYGRATGIAAQMLLAKLYLNAAVYTGTANYAAALTAAQAVIAGPYTLDGNYRRIFSADNNTSPEIIFAIPQDGLRTQTWGGVTFLVHASCGGTMSNSAYGIDGCWWGIRLKPQAYNAFPAADRRQAYFVTAGQSVGVSSITDFTNGVAAPKFTNVTSTGTAGSHPTHVDTDFPMFRLADAYLIYAEAALRGGGGSTAQALTYVNALRQRAYGNTSGNITATELTLPFILAERQRELLWEGHRRTDLVRFGQFTGNTYVWAWKGGTVAGTGTDAKYNLYPIPANELIANPNLKQNTGY